MSWMHSDSERISEYLQIVKAYKPSIAFFAEAYKTDDQRHVADTVSKLEKMGYSACTGPYDGSDGRPDKHSLLLAVRSELLSPSRPPRLVRIAIKNIAECWITRPNGQAVHFLGMHLNDRSEAKRQTELDSLVCKISPDREPTILAGDFNSIHAADAHGKLFRRARRIHLLVRLKLMPITHPTGKPMPNSRGRTGSIFYRLHEMASGKTIGRLLAQGFTDADSQH